MKPFRFTNIFQNFFYTGHERTIRAKQNISLSFLFKVINISIGFILIPLSIQYVDKSSYGIWLTLSSVIYWIGFFDIGFGNGLKNRFGEAIAHGNIELARKYVSTTYASVAFIMGVVVVLYAGLSPLINWSVLINAPSSLNNTLAKLAFIVIVFFACQFTLQIINVVLTASQKTAKASVISCFGNILTLIFVFTLSRYTHGNLFLLGLSVSSAPVLVFIVAHIILYRGELKEFKPSMKFVDFRYVKELLGIGIKFFLIQVSFIILYQTTNLIIAHYYGPEEVTIYNIALKYFSLITMGFSIIIAPYWSAFTEAYHKKDFSWIKNTVKTMVKVWLSIVVVGFIMLLFSEQIYLIWIGEDIRIPFELSLVIWIYVSLYSFGSIYVTFLNGAGKIHLQLISSFISPVIFIGIVYILKHSTGLGIISVIIATILANFFGPIIAPLQYYKIINGDTKNILNK